MERGGTIVSELEGTLLHDSDLFPYFMLTAFETSGLLRFIVLLLAWPLIRVLDLLHMGDLSLQIMVFIAVAGVKVVEIETVASSVLPKFFVDVIDTDAWNAFMSFEQQVVVTRCPRLMVERFGKEYLRADGVVGAELQVNRFGYATGLLNRMDRSITDRVMEFLGGEWPDATMARAESKALLALGKEQLQPPYWKLDCQPIRPPRVIFHDGRLVHRPTPLASLAVIFWIPIGIVLAFLRICAGAFPIRYALFFTRLSGCKVVVRGRPPPRASGSTSGVLFVCTHRSLMDPVVLATVLGRSVPAVTYSLSRLSEILSPIPTVRLTRNRQADAERIRAELAKGDLAVCPEGTTCREPFLLRFSALFAELTDRIVPVAMNNRVGLFHGTTARGWKAMDPIFFLMNPRPFYEVTFLEQLPMEATCSGGKSPHDVANHVQKILASALGFECTNFTRKHKYRALVGHDGRASFKRTASFKRMTSFKRTASFKRTRSQRASQSPNSVGQMAS